MIEATLPKGKLSILKGPYPQLGLTGPFACTVQASQCQCCSCRDATGAASQSLQTLLSEGAMQESEGPAEGYTCEATNCPTVVLYTVCPAEGQTVQASASATYSKAGIERCWRILRERSAACQGELRRSCYARAVCNTQAASSQVGLVKLARSKARSNAALDTCSGKSTVRLTS